MGLLRCRRDEAVSRRFRMREKLIAVGDEYWIGNDVGDKVFKVNGMAARVRDRWVLENASGVEAGRIKERKPTIRDSIKIDLDGGEAHVTKALAGIRGRFHIEVAGDDLKAPGNDVGGPVTRRALGNGEIDVALLFTTDPAIDSEGLVELVDDRGLESAENVAALIRTEVIDRWGPGMVDVIDGGSRLFIMDAVRGLNGDVVVESGSDAAAVAAAWLQAKGAP
jgi:hypothetical protein